jgi:hypothetical protein
MQLDARCFHDDQKRNFLGILLYVWHVRMKKCRFLRQRLEKRMIFEEKGIFRLKIADSFG